MELQAVLVLCGAGVAVVAVLLLAGLFSTTGTSYEEAVAQQRRATTELLALASNKNKPKKAKKANKKLAKKEKKENASAATASDPESEAPGESGVDEETPAATRPHVEFSPPIVVDVPRDTPPNVKIRKRGKDPKVKPILINKEDPSCISESVPPSPTGSSVSNHFEEIHPKDEFELKIAAQALEKAVEKKEEVIEKKEDKKEVKSKPMKGGKAAKVQPPPEPVKEEAPPARERQNSGEQPKEQRKAKKADKKPVVEEVVELPKEEVVPPLNVPQPSELTTEKLLKQAMLPPPAQPSPPASTGKGRKNKKPEPNMLSLMAGDGGGVNVGELVRLMSEAALSRTEIQILTDALLNKHHDPLPQHSEWTEGPNDPMQKLKKQLSEKEKALADELEASQALHAKLKELRSLLNAERSRATATTRAMEETAASQRAEVHTLQTRLQRLLEGNHSLAQEKMHSEATLMQQLAALQAEASARAIEAGQARCEVTAVRDSLLMTQQHVAELGQQLQEANRVCSELDSQRQSAIHAEQVSQQEIRQLQETLSGMSELQGEVHRLTERVKQAETTKEEIEKHNQQLTRDLASAWEQATASESELRQLKAAPAHNGLPPHTEHKASEMSKVEGIIESLRAELAAAQSTSQEHKEQVTKLQEQIKLYQDKNNELRTKNWKVMEALQSAEKSLQKSQTNVFPASLPTPESQYTEMATVLKNACPSLAPASAPGRAWLETFAANLKTELSRSAQSKVVVKTVSDESRVEELRAQNDQLQATVDKYKRIIDDTEGVLSRLQQNVTQEEERWAHKLNDMQQQIDSLSQRDMQSQNKILSLEAELQQLKQSNSKHNFTDSERLTEENSRLMAGLSDKHKVDSYNGPLEVELKKI